MRIPLEIERMFYYYFSMEKREKFWQRLEKIKEFYFTKKRMPSLAEMAKLFHLKSKNSVFFFCQKLINEGFLEKDEKGRILPGKKLKPLKILGRIQAGFPNTTEEEVLETISLDDFLVKNPRSTFVIKVSGDSMIGAGIMPGDYILVDRTMIPKNGQIVVAQVDGDWTLKYFEKQGNRVCLRAANKKYPPIFPQQELMIAGVVIGVVRKY